MNLKLNQLAATVLLFSFLPGGRLTAQDNVTKVDLPRHAIVFAHHTDAGRKNYDIWQIAPAGTQMASVVVLPNHQTQFTISPNGDELIYVDAVDGRNDLWRRAFHGKDAINLTKSESNESSPCWSPDGTKVLFSSNRDSQKNEIYLMSLDSREIERLTKNELYESEACWSPDGKQIIFTGSVEN